MPSVMRLFARNLLVSLLLAVYLIAFVGVNFHECERDHTVELVGVLSADSCSGMHHDGRDHHCGHLEAETGDATGMPQLTTGDCCANSFHILSDEQLRSSCGDGLHLDVFALCQLFEQRPMDCPLNTSVFNRSVRSRVASSGKVILEMYSVRRA